MFDGTYFSQRGTLDLVPALEDAKDLRNIYHVIVVKPIPGRPSNLAGGEAFAHTMWCPPTVSDSSRRTEKSASARGSASMPARFLSLDHRLPSRVRA
jgi:hypothetical protein